ncbi:hypothetical protein HMN09_00201600 [Mycena chlorophos]|uniref:Fe2OG dioxygenase domain-containing protein n=1 Tax=Mycena chlorophos TaxID=658473 RepID=A0A8H6TP19_MYCCL|nr:hypothetical protein HMN09_00201600 [Mycena chlorophos]
MDSEPIFNLSEHRVPGPATCYYIPDFITARTACLLAALLKILLSSGGNNSLIAGGSSCSLLQLWGSSRSPLRSSQEFTETGGELTSNNALIAQPMPPFVESYPDIIARLQRTGAFARSPHGKPNHIIMNEYRPGQGECYVTYFAANPPQPSDVQGIMPHEDGPAYHPVVATISLQSHCVFHYYRYKEDENGPETAGKSIDPTPVLSVLLEPRSVVISQDDLYASHLHAIREVEEDVIHSTLLEIDQSMRLPIANRDKLTSPSAIQFVNEGGTLKRETRYSLTCRDVQKVVQLKALFGKR